MVLIVLLAPQIAMARVVRHGSIPQAYWGTWMPSTDACGGSDKSAVTLAAKTYKGPTGSCAVEYVSETPGAEGPIFSAHLRCSSSGAQKQTTSTTDLLMRPDKDGRIALGPGFETLVAYRRCDEKAK